jgi:hypothetical protein
MTTKKLTGVIGAVVLGFLEIAERADFIKSHLPEGLSKMDLQPYIFAAFIALILWVIFAPEHAAEEERSRPSNTNTNAGNATASGIGVLNVYPAALQETPKSADVPPTKETPLPNIHLIRAREALLEENPMRGSVYEVREKSSVSFPAIVADFRLESGGRASWPQVHASITFRRKDLSEICHVSRANWVGGGIMTSFSLLTNITLLLMYADKEGRSFWADGGDTGEIEDEDQIEYADIVLHDPRGLTLPTFTLVFESDGIRLITQP